MAENLTVLAGKKALAKIRDSGLSPGMVDVVAGAAGGPKWLLLNRLDRFLVSSWFAGRTRPLHLIGSSIGAWRFAALSQQDPLKALDRFTEAYIGQTYEKKPSAQDVTDETQHIMDAYLDDEAVRHVLNHPYLRINLLAVYCRRLGCLDAKAALGPYVAASALANLVDRRFLRWFYKRALFYNPKTPPPFLHMNGFPTLRIPLDEANFRSALLATGSIPLVMSGVKSIPGAPRGVYRDGGVIDYHLDIEFSKRKDMIVLYPHYRDRIVPGWFDKKLHGRKPNAERMANVVMLAPSESFVSDLPYGKISDRNDFWLFKGKDRERIRYWKTVVDRGRLLAGEFEEAVESGRIRHMARPLCCL